jgi:hypothetical protein
MAELTELRNGGIDGMASGKKFNQQNAKNQNPVKILSLQL